LLPPEYTVLDSTGALVRHVEYTAFGRHANGTAPIADFLFGFTGRPFDDATGLYDYRARWYDPEVGRFASEDPLGFAAGDVNLYRYAGNSPVMHVDPSGLCFTGLANAAKSVGNVMGGAISSVGSYFGSSSPTLSTLAGSIGQAFGSGVSYVGSSIGQAFSSVGVSAGYLGQAISTVGGYRAPAWLGQSGAVYGEVSKWPSLTNQIVSSNAPRVFDPIIPQGGDVAAGHVIPTIDQLMRDWPAGDLQRLDSLDWNEAVADVLRMTGRLTPPGLGAAPVSDSSSYSSPTGAFLGSLWSDARDLLSAYAEAGYYLATDPQARSTFGATYYDTRIEPLGQRLYAKAALRGYSDAEIGDWWAIRPLGQSVLFDVLPVDPTAEYLEQYDLGEGRALQGVELQQRGLMAMSGWAGTVAAGTAAASRVPGLGTRMYPPAATSTIGRSGDFIPSAELEASAARLRAAGAPKAPAQVTVNRQTGLTFQQKVVGSMGAQPGRAMVGTTLRGTQYTTIPDGILPSGGLLEVKAGQYIANSPQLQAQAWIGRQSGVPSTLVVRPGATVSAPAIRSLGHSAATPTIQVYNSSTRTFTPYP